MTIPAADFGLGAPLSATARAGTSVALRQINRLVYARNRQRAAVASNE